MGLFAGGASDTEALHRDGKLKQLLNISSHDFQYDLVVIGGGSGGLAASKVCIQYKSKNNAYCV